LTKNLAHLKDKVVISNSALGDREGEAKFTYYPNYTIMSSMVADKQRDHEVLSAGAKTQYERQHGAADERTVELLVGKKLEEAQTFNCRISTLSNVIETFGIKRVSLVKVDVECAENIVLAGIREEHWPLIDQLVVEVHDQGAREHETMRDMLETKGYHVKLMTESNLKNSGIFEIIARR
jgi:FkbM family methyltransferase